LSPEPETAWAAGLAPRPVLPQVGPSRVPAAEADLFRPDD